MAQPVLSVCIPTYNRCELLKETLTNITSDEVFLSTYDVEIIISDNCSPDKTQEVCKEFVEKYPDKIKYYRQEHNINDRNFVEILKLANGKYAKLHNDTVCFHEKYLEEIVENLKNINTPVIFFGNRHIKQRLIVETYSDINKFLKKYSYLTTWIGGLCVKTDEFLQLSNPDRFCDRNFCQIDILIRLSANNQITVLEGHCMDALFVKKKGGYNVAQVFGENFLWELSVLKQEKYISHSTFAKVKKDMLLKQINPFYFDLRKKYDYHKTGYFKFLLPNYKYNFYFYIAYLFMQIKGFIYKICFNF